MAGEGVTTPRHEVFKARHEWMVRGRFPVEDSLALSTMWGRGLVARHWDPYPRPPMTDHVTLRTISPEEVPDFLRAIELAFSERPTEEEIAHESSVTEPDRSLAAMDGAAMVGTAGAFSRELTIPGGTIPMAAVTMVGVVATHRRQGILRMLMRRQLEDVRERGEVVAGLTASEGAIYGRFGYGMATLAGRFQLDKRTAVLRGSPSPAGRIELVPLEEALQLMPIPFERVRRTTPGCWPARQCGGSTRPATSSGGGTGPAPCFIASTGPRTRSTGTCRTGSSTTGRKGFRRGPSSCRSSWRPPPRPTRTCGGSSSASTWPHASRAGHGPATSRCCTCSPSRAAFGSSSATDCGSAWSTCPGPWRRGATGPTAAWCWRSVDEFFPANQGRYALEGGPDGVTCRPTDADPDLELAVEDLGAAYLGGTSFDALAQAGRVRILRAGADARADAMFGTARAPWCPNHF